MYLAFLGIPFLGLNFTDSQEIPKTKLWTHFLTLILFFHIVVASFL